MRHTSNARRSLILQGIFALAVMMLIFYPLVLKNFFALDFTPNAQTASFAKTLEETDYSPPFFVQVISSFFSALNLGRLSIAALLVLGILLVIAGIRKLSEEYQFAAAGLYVFNPFTYSRLMSGQIGVLLGYFCLPLIASQSLNYIKKKDASELAKLLLLFFVLSMMHPSMLILGFVIFLVILIAYRENLPSAKPLLAGAAVLLLLCSMTIQGAVSGVSQRQIGPSDASFFSPHLTPGVPTVAKVIGMWGFWREDAYLTTYAALPLLLWYLLTAIVLATFLVGYATTSEKPESKLFFALWWIGVVLAVGISHPYTRPLFEFLFAHVPFFSGFRDSHKFVALVALAYAFLCPVGVMAIARKAKAAAQRYGRRAAAGAYYAIPALFAAAIVLYTYPLIGLWGQVHPASYPASYADTDAYLATQRVTGNIVYLPYYDYLTYNWTAGATPDGRIANPINKLVAPVVITNPGPWGAQTSKTQAIGKCIDGKSIACLEAQDVQLVLVDTCYADYATLDFSWLPAPEHKDACVEVRRLANAHEVDRTQRVPARFIAGAAISLATLIGCVAFLIVAKRKQRAGGAR